MSEKMTTISFDQFLNQIVEEEKNHKSIFGIKTNNFFRTNKNSNLLFINESIETPIGPAAGPHTQMAQNIIAAYLTGGRFFELKTVQQMDELHIDRPCIDAEDEGYNVEWSQELKLEQSFDEYLKAWILIHFIKHHFAISKLPERGFIFNMSVGYDLNGIKTERMDRFIEHMKDASKSELFENYKSVLINFIKSRLDNNHDLIELTENISPFISNSVTLSTMHGCPPNEIESIVKYLITEKQLNTYVKLNPTLLGFDLVRNTLDNLGYNKIQLDKHSFEIDLQWKDAVNMIDGLQSFAKENGKEFGVKLSNTLAVKNLKQKMPGDNMYMSGRALFALTINLASKLSSHFEGKLKISYSGGASVHNTKDIFETGIFPITYATELLKPGGYNRLKQIAESLVPVSVQKNSPVDNNKLTLLAKKSLTDTLYKKETRTAESIKVPDHLGTFDCFIAPCKVACSIHQDVPEYIRLVGEDKFDEALRVITEKNPLPHITGYICDHQCMFHCTRIDYDEAVKIRDLKKEVALNGFDSLIKQLESSSMNINNIRVAVIGAGPSGLAASYFLARNGFDVTVFEKENHAGGIVQNVLPKFRLPQSAIDQDIKLIEQYGVRFIFGSQDISIKQLKNEGYKYIYIAIGAEKANLLELSPANDKVLSAIDFLKEFRNSKVDLGEHVAVIGGGNSAMDSARAALRCEGVKKVFLIYRRTKEFMPADREEFEAALADGVIYKELLSPTNYDNEILTCQKMALSEIDKDGRRKITPLHNQLDQFNIDTVISAIGESIDEEFFLSNNISLNNSNKVIVNAGTNETSLENVFVGGDSLRGPATVVEAIADGRKAADAIIRKESINPTQNDYDKLFEDKNLIGTIESTKGFVTRSSKELKVEASRCLSCNVVCNKCVDVCPNRANIEIKTFGSLFNDLNQILHIDSLCNECGNCETFCPHQGAPYKDKFTFYSSLEEFSNGKNDGFVLTKNGEDKILIRNNGAIEETSVEFIKSNHTQKQYELISSVLENYSYLIMK